MKMLVVGLIAAGIVGTQKTANASNDTFNFVNDGLQASYDSWSEYVGNTDVGAAHLYSSHETASWNGKALSAVYLSDHSYSQSWQVMSDYVYLFGAEIHPLGVFVSGQADMFGKAAPFRYAQSSDAQFAVLGNAVGSVAHTNCGTYNCTTQSATVSKTLAGGSGTFMVSFVPVTVGGWIEGTLYENITGRGRAEALNGVQGQFKGESSSEMKAGARLNAHFYTFAGVRWLAAVGVTSDITLVDVNVSPTSANLVARGGAIDTVAWANTVPVTVSTMNGSVDVWGELFGGYVSTNIASWNGYSATTNLFNVSGARLF
jgi:hypothetical protein